MVKIQTAVVGIYLAILYAVATPKIKEELTIEAGSRLLFPAILLGIILFGVGFFVWNLKKSDQTSAF